ncbi:MAG: TonB family protein [Methylotenera sp.]|nr:TonB family protein [Methylotenera sp.]
MPLIRTAVYVSVLIHVILISVHFSPDFKKMADSIPVLDVSLVNAKTHSKPNKADVLAQANLDRGGNTNQNRKMQSVLAASSQQQTALKAQEKNQPGGQAAQQKAEQSQAQKRVADLEKQARELMTQLQANKTVVTQSVQKTSTQEVQTGQQQTPSKAMDVHDMASAAMEMDRLEALIAKQQDVYQKRPKRKFIGARTKEYKYALYVESWRQKVEKIGNLNYPEAARNLKLYGQLQMTVSINADGSIESIELNRSSGHKLLDEAAKHIVELGAPYAHFPDEVQSEIDILSITRTWTFTKEDSLASGD